MASRTLTDLAAKKAKPKDKPYKLGAGSGLYLEVMPNGSKYWRLKYRVAGQEKRLALGVYSVEVDAVNSSGSVLDSLNSAIDVSSSWTKFPRYGYVADYPSTLSTADAWHDMWLLKNYHIHGVQFYD